MLYVRFAELPVADQDRAVSFYTEKLGFRVAEDVPYRDGWRWIELEIPGAQTKILLTRKSDNEGGKAREAGDGAPRLVLNVDDVYALHRELKEKGVDFAAEPTVGTWGGGEVFAMFWDSEDNLVMVGTEKD